jgi:uncharacterized protein GlcG (DUF336 family)
VKTEDAKRMLEAARVKATEIGKPVSVCVLDAAGAIVVLERLNDAPPFTAVVAEGKAAASAFTGRDSSTLKGMSENAPFVFNAVVTRMQGQRFAPHQGAVPVRDSRGDLVGAVGVSGATADEDEAIARAGAEAYGA